MIFCFKNINLKILAISFVLSVVLIFFQLGTFQNGLNIDAKVDNSMQDVKEYDFKLENMQNPEKNVIKDENETINISESLKEWTIRIPKINLEAQIENGTTTEILNKFVGHFEETPKQNGNIGLAAHNRGYNVNYFEKIKLLEVGDEIYYSYCDIEKVYIVQTKNIIEDIAWEWLENTEDNRITLITCVENQPKYRLCVQGIEK